MRRREFMGALGGAMAGEALAQKPKESDWRENLQPAFQKIVEQTGAVDLLTTPEFKEVQTPADLDRLFKTCRAADPNPAREIAVAARFLSLSAEFLRGTYIWTIPESAPAKPEELRRYYSQGGYVTFKSLEKYLRITIAQNQITLASLKDLNRTFQTGSDFFHYLFKSLEGKNRPAAKVLNERCRPLFELLDSFFNLSFEAAPPKKMDQTVVATKIREIVLEKLLWSMPKEFSDVCFYMGGGRFLIDNTETLTKLTRGFHRAGFAESGRNAEKFEKGIGGVVHYSAKIVGYLNGARKETGQLSAEDQMLADLLVENKCIRLEVGKFVADSNIPQIMLASVSSYLHEKQHYELARRPELVRYWVGEWNNLSPKDRAEFVKDKADYTNLPPEELRGIVNVPFTPEEISQAQELMLKGENGDGLRRKCEILQEYYAYSTDNSFEHYYNEKHENPF